MALDQELADYIRFHLEVSGCRACQANFDDLKRRQTDEPAAVDSRRKKYFQSMPAICDVDNSGRYASSAFLAIPPRPRSAWEGAR